MFMVQSGFNIDVGMSRDLLFWMQMNCVVLSWLAKLMVGFVWYGLHRICPSQINVFILFNAMECFIMDFCHGHIVCCPKCHGIVSSWAFICFVVYWRDVSTTHQIEIPFSLPGSDIVLPPSRIELAWRVYCSAKIRIELVQRIHCLVAILMPGGPRIQLSV